MKQKHNCGISRQQGIALPIIMIILVLAALVTIYTTTTSVKELQVTADQYRSEQAFSAAQAGIDIGLKNHNDYSPEYDEVTGDLLPSGADIPSPAEFSKGSYITMFCDIWDDAGDKDKSAEMMADFLKDTTICTNPISNVSTAEPDGFKDDERVGILSVGKPDDASGRRTISVVSAPGFKFGGGPPGPPFTARGSSGLTGNVKLINRYTNLTMWLGEDLDFNSAATETFINNGDLKRSNSPDGEDGDRAYRLAMMDPDSTHYALGVSNVKIGQNADALTGDANLMNISPDEMFAGVFRSSKIDMKIMAKETGVYYTEIDEIDEYQTGLIWLEPSGSFTLNKYLGTFEAPALLVVEFPNPDTDILTLQGGNTTTDLGKMQFGQFFIFGNLNQNGSPVIIGSLILAEDAPKLTGGGTIVYDPESLKTKPEGPAGLRGIVPGTWKDWGYVN